MVGLPYHASGFPVVLNVDLFVQSIEVIVFSPFLRVFELGQGILGDKLPRTKITTMSGEYTARENHRTDGCNTLKYHHHGWRVGYWSQADRAPGQH